MGSKGGGKDYSEGKLKLLMQIVEQLENRLREVEGITFDQVFSPTDQVTIQGAKASGTNYARQDKLKPGALGSPHLHVFAGFSRAVP